LTDHRLPKAAGDFCAYLGKLAEDFAARTPLDFSSALTPAQLGRRVIVRPHGFPSRSNLLRLAVLPRRCRRRDVR
jgi:hypothetical protein